ncbi:hypothetical protein BC830DRAFT_1152559 [Chytriomyces sp. MP71]|nr:hypothetical protein BC830DRAFT_1152559 [Chytriomyces sp. MP71]
MTHSQQLLTKHPSSSPHFPTPSSPPSSAEDKDPALQPFLDAAQSHSLARPAAREPFPLATAAPVANQAPSLMDRDSTKDLQSPLNQIQIQNPMMMAQAHPGSAGRQSPPDSPPQPHLLAEEEQSVAPPRQKSVSQNMDHSIAEKNRVPAESASSVSVASSRRPSLPGNSNTMHKTKSSASSSATPALTKRQNIVFVDPDDANAPWWWPAIVVPQKEFHEFRRAYALDMEEPKDGEYLVCYFEDASFSTIPETAAIPFNPNQHPYTTYLHGPDGDEFKQDNAVRLATEYYSSGVPPASFVWLHGGSILPGHLSGVVPGAPPRLGLPSGMDGAQPALTLPTQASSKRSRQQQLQLNSAAAAAAFETGGGGGSKRSNGSVANGSGREIAAGGKKVRREVGASESARFSSRPFPFFDLFVALRQTSPPSISTSGALRTKGGLANTVNASPVAKRGNSVSSKSDKVEQRESSSVEPSPGPVFVRKSSVMGIMAAGVPSSAAALTKRGSKADINGMKPNSVSPPKTMPMPGVVSSSSMIPLGNGRTRQPPQQVVVGSNVALCTLCGKPSTNCVCATSPYQQFHPVVGVGASSASASLQYASQFQHPVLASQAGHHTTPKFHEAVASSHHVRSSFHVQPGPPYGASSSSSASQQRPIVSSSESHVATGAQQMHAQQAPPAAVQTPVNMFAPICVQKRGDRGEFLMLRGIVPINSRKGWMDDFVVGFQ